MSIYEMETEDECQENNVMMFERTGSMWSKDILIYWPA